MTGTNTSSFFFFNDTATTEIYTLSLHDALPICSTRLNNTNNFTVGAGAHEMYFKSGAGAFNLYGNSLTFFDFGGVDLNIQNEGTTSQTMNIPFLNGNANGANGILNINLNTTTAQGPLVFNGTIGAADANIAT